MKSKRYLVPVMVVVAVGAAGEQMFVKAENRAGTSKVAVLGEGLLYGRDSVIIRRATPPN